MGSHAQAIGALLQSTHTATAEFLDRYLKPDIDPSELGPLRVRLKNILENHRSVLEYTAHYLAERCSPKPSAENVQFPVAKGTDTQADFERKLNKWFPGLRTAAPHIIPHLLGIQTFAGETWLRQLADLTNFNKHHSLSEQEIGSFESVLIRYDGCGIRLGELGFRSVAIEEGGSIRFIAADGQYAEIRAPCRLDVSIVRLAMADRQIEIAREQRQLYRISGQSNSIAGTVWSIAQNVYQTVNKICASLT